MEFCEKINNAKSQKQRLFWFHERLGLFDSIFLHNHCILLSIGTKIVILVYYTPI